MVPVCGAGHLYRFPHPPLISEFEAYQPPERKPAAFLKMNVEKRHNTT